MPLLLRKIRKSCWLPPDWLGEGEVPADILIDLQTETNSLSVWVVESEGEIGRLVAALGANCDNLGNVDYAQVEYGAIDEMNLKVEGTHGDIPDLVASRWHADLTQLTAAKVTELADIFWHLGKTVRVQAKEVGRLIAEGVNKEWIDRNALKDRILRRMERLSLL